jgi:thiol-disulfide isomerase/thioredoxin
MVYPVVKRHILALILMCTLTAVAIGQDVKQYLEFDKFNEEVLQRSSDDTIYVINFWATWCAPCVHELPFFVDLDKRINSHPVKVILVSLDFSRQLDTKFYPWLKAHPQEHEVVLLLDPKPNSWIDKVDKSWSGAIPFTYVYRGRDHVTYEGSFADAKDLDDYIDTFIKTL